MNQPGHAAQHPLVFPRPFFRKGSPSGTFAQTAGTVANDDLDVCCIILENCASRMAFLMRILNLEAF
jgi:hypothetical protein